MTWAVVIDGVVQRVAAEKPHPDALPVRRVMPDACPIENEVVERLELDWIVHSDHVEATYAVMPLDIDQERAAAKRAARDECAARTREAVDFAGLLMIMPDQIDFEDGGAWRTLSRDEAMDMAEVMSRHASACLAHCRSMHERLDACASVSEIRQIDVNTWPQRGAL